MTSPGVPSQTDIEHAATSRCARSRWSSASWLRPLLVIVTLMVLALFRGPDASGQIPLAVRWLLVALLGVAAWTCPPRFVIPFSLAAIVGWSWIEVGTATSFVWLPGHLVRLIVAMGLVASVVKLRERLASAQQLA